METEEAITSRRAVKHYDPEYTMGEEEKQLLLELAMHSPTAFNIQNWRFLVVDEPKQRQRLCEAAGGQQQVLDASMLIVLCADLQAWQKQPERYWHSAPQKVQDFVLPAIHDYYAGKEQTMRDEAMRSCGIAAQTLMLAATSMGYESCPMDGFYFDEVARIINLPADHIVTMFVVIGKGIKEPWERPGQLPREDVVVQDRF
ncbi:MAG: nitroreductase family protein [Desulfobulbaceae bacterium]|jgi:nitroreductase|nr:nitroreductase family protein [Desulfobulbaceae bacterium]